MTSVCNVATLQYDQENHLVFVFSLGNLASRSLALEVFSSSILLIKLQSVHWSSSECSCALDFALRLPDVACTSSQRNDVGDHGDNDRIHRILRVRLRDFVPLVELRLPSTNKTALLVQRRLRWCGHAARPPEGDLIKDLLLPARRAGGQLKAWATTTKAALEPVSGPRVFNQAR